MSHCLFESRSPLGLGAGWAFFSFAFAMSEDILSLNKLITSSLCLLIYLIIECFLRIIGDIYFCLGLLSILVILGLLKSLREKDVITVAFLSFPKEHFQTSPSTSLEVSDLLKAKEGELAFSVTFVMRVFYSIQLKHTHTQWKA